MNIHFCASCIKMNEYTTDRINMHFCATCTNGLWPARSQAKRADLVIYADLQKNPVEICHIAIYAHFPQLQLAFANYKKIKKNT
jgi:hypothetical protein